MKIMIDLAHTSQRIDNYLISVCKGVPKTRIYRAIRTGEVRVNQKRVKPEYRLQYKDELRIPPFRMSKDNNKQRYVPKGLLTQIETSILLETKDYILFNKPSGIPVHGGTGVQTGLIEAVRELRPKAKFLELVHRIDRDTSGCLLVAKKRSVLRELHDLLLHKKVKKHYLALVRGSWQGKSKKITAPLKKNHLASGERVVVVSKEGKAAETIFRPLVRYQNATLIEAVPVTGRTHQIRVHAAHIGHPIAGDEKYGDRDFNKLVKSFGVNRLFLHSASIYCKLNRDFEEIIGLCAMLDEVLKAALKRLP